MLYSLKQTLYKQHVCDFSTISRCKAPGEDPCPTLMCGGAALCCSVPLWLTGSLRPSHTWHCQGPAHLGAKRKNPHTANSTLQQRKWLRMASLHSGDQPQQGEQPPNPSMPGINPGSSSSSSNPSSQPPGGIYPQGISNPGSSGPSRAPIQSPASPQSSTPAGSSGSASASGTSSGSGSGAPGAPPRGAALGPQHVVAIAQRWLPLLPDTPHERNRLLSRRMKALTYPGAI